jgi:hypothetical protein
MDEVEVGLLTVAEAARLLRLSAAAVSDVPTVRKWVTGFKE